MIRRVFVPLSIVLLAVLMLTVWPTMWRYDHMGGAIVRINRVSGTAYMLTGEGWRPLTAEAGLDSLVRQSYH